MRFLNQLISQITAAMIAKIQSRCSATEVTANTARATTQITTRRIAIANNECFTASDRTSPELSVHLTARPFEAGEQLL